MAAPSSPSSTSTAPADLSTATFRGARPSIAGPDAPAPPFPIALRGAVQKGFGRGGKDLGCPTANLPEEALLPLSAATTTGIYYGFAQVLPRFDRASDSGSDSGSSSGARALCAADREVHPMAMSLGWNPFYKNERLSAEVHIMHGYRDDFYGNEMRVLVLGYIRPELDYTSREALIDDIETDKKVAIRSLARLAYARYASDSLFDSSNSNFEPEIQEHKEDSKL